jgi:muramoyltetrapeptide carboxypeptidase
LIISSNLAIFAHVMNIIKPHRLRKGDIIGICAPASPLQSRDSIEDGINYLERLGYRVHLAKNLYRKRGYLAGTDAQRAADLHELFSNRTVKAIFAARGGFGTQRLLPLLDYSLIKHNPKILVGYSDITALQLALLANVRLVSLAGPLVVEMPLKGKAEEFFWRALTSTKPLGVIRATDKQIFNHRGKSTAHTGQLIGGNLSLISAMAGSLHFPRIGNPIVFLEEIDERPYRIDRTLQHLKLNGLFDSAHGLVLGSFIDCTPAKGKPSLTLQQVFGDAFSNAPFPVASGVRHGHLRGSIALPIGVRASLARRSKGIEILESLVS